MKPTDEELMAWADGTLDAVAHARVAAAVAADPALAARAEAFSMTGRSLGTLFDAKLAESPPAALLDLLQPPPAGVPGVTPLRKPRALWLPFAMAASLALGVALGVNWPRPDAPPLALAGLPDGAQLSAALERVASGEPIELSTGGVRVEFMPTATYRENSGRWCREFRSATLDSDARMLGIACRTGAEIWTTEVVLSDTYAGIVQDEGYFAASGAPAMQGGAPVSPEEEAALIASGWKS